jgi:hypothetical protein
LLWGFDQDLVKAGNFPQSVFRNFVGKTVNFTTKQTSLTNESHSPLKK